MTQAQEKTDRVIPAGEMPRGEPDAQFRQALRMETIGRFAAGVAHDFNNLLVVIVGCGELALERVNSKDPLHEDIREIISAAEMASSLVRQLLTFARDGEVRPCAFSINDLISEMKGLLLAIVGRDVELITNLDPRTGHIVADPVQIQRVIMNLVVNACDGMTKGDKLIIETSNTAPAGSTDARVLLRVADTGPGVDEETLAHIWEPFFTTKAKSGGTGLGLAIVCDTVKECGGSIAVHSQPGQGTSFQVFLPRAGNAERDA